MFKGSNGIGDIDHPFIITTRMSTHFCSIDIDIRLLTSSFEVQHRTPMGKRIVNGQLRPVPGRSLVIVDIGIDGIPRIDTMREAYPLPGWNAPRITGGRRPDGLPDTTEIRTNEFPMVRKTDRQYGAFRRGRLLSPNPRKGGDQQQDGIKRLSKSNHKTNLTSFRNFLNYYTKALLAKY